MVLSSQAVHGVQFNGAGETDGGLGFGFSFRAADAGGADDGNGGSVFISQGGHTLAMGDVDSAANAAVGQVSGVGLTGLGDLNEVNYDLNEARQLRRFCIRTAPVRLGSILV